MSKAENLHRRERFGNRDFGKQKNLDAGDRNREFWFQMRRRTYRQIRANNSASHHHNVYVVLLAPEAAKLSKVRAENPGRKKGKTCVYVGMTGLTPEERFQNHKNGVKAARVVQLFGLRLMPELYEIFNPMPFEAAVEMERELAEDLRSQGYVVAGGH